MNFFQPLRAYLSFLFMLMVISRPSTTETLDEFLDQDKKEKISDYAFGEGSKPVITLTDKSFTSKIREIGQYFACVSTRVEEINLTLSDLRVIGKRFANELTSLKSVTLELPALEEIEDGFLLNCGALERVNLILPAVKSIGSSFLKDATSLKSITLELPALEEIKDGFLLNCGAMERVNLILPAVKSIGSSFLEMATSLNQLTLELPALEEVGANFLLMANSKLNAPLRLRLPKLRRAGDCFLLLSGSGSGLSLELPALEEVGNNFLSMTKTNAPSGRPQLNTSTLNRVEKQSFNFPNLKKIGSNFLSYNMNTELTVRLGALEKVEPGFLLDSSQLKKITIVAPNLTYIDRDFLLGCTLLEEVHFDFPKLVATSENCWLEGSPLLERFVLKAPLLKEIKEPFLSKSARPKELDLSGCSALERKNFELLNKKKRFIDVKLPSSLASISSTVTTASPDSIATATKTTLSLNYSDWILPSLLLWGMLFFLYYTSSLKVKKKKKKEKKKEEKEEEREELAYRAYLMQA